MTKKSKNKKTTRLSDLKLRVMAEYASSGIWVIGQVGSFRHGGVGYEWLSLPQDLAQRFEQWIELYWGRLDYLEFAHINFNADEFNRAGRQLAKELKDHVGPEGYVEYIPELEDGGSGKAEIVE